MGWLTARAAAEGGHEGEAGDVVVAQLRAVEAQVAAGTLSEERARAKRAVILGVPLAGAGKL